MNVRKVALLPWATAPMGFSRDFYEYSGVDRTDYSLAFEGACKSGWQGRLCRIGRTQTMDPSEVLTSWAEDAYTSICDYLGPDGLLITVVHDKLSFEDSPYTEDNALDQMTTIMTGHAASTGQPKVMAALGNEPYIGASGTHCELDSTYAGRVMDLAASIRSAHPTVLLGMPALGTFQESTVTLCKSTLEANWDLYISLFAGHGIFDATLANLYRWDGAAGDDTNRGISVGARYLREAAALLGCAPIVSEIGIHNPTALGLKQAMIACGTDLPQVVWKIGAGDDYDMIAAGAIAVPAA